MEQFPLVMAVFIPITEEACPFTSRPAHPNVEPSPQPITDEDLFHFSYKEQLWKGEPNTLNNWWNLFIQILWINILAHVAFFTPYPPDEHRMCQNCGACKLQRFHQSYLYFSHFSSTKSSSNSRTRKTSNITLSEQDISSFFERNLLQVIVEVLQRATYSSSSSSIICWLWKKKIYIYI